MFRGSLLNEIVGPVMRGPSSSHTAAPYGIALASRQLALASDRALVEAIVRFDPDGSFAAVHKAQGSDEGFAAGLLGLGLDSDQYQQAVTLAYAVIGFRIEITPLRRADHPNSVELMLRTIDAEGRSTVDVIEAVSTGGGSFALYSINDVVVEWSGETSLEIVVNGRTRRAAPAGSPVVSKPPFDLTATSLLGAHDSHLLLSDMCIAYEAAVLGLHHDTARLRFTERLGVLLASARAGFDIAPERHRLRFLRPSARGMLASDPLPTLIGRTQHVATAAAIAVMEHDVARGVLVAAPTAGSAGILPGVLFSLTDAGFARGEVVDAFCTMAIVGGAFAWNGTFAAECGGCAVETGAAGAMAAAGLVTAHGGSASEAFDAASLVLVNTLGLVCDPVAGEVEIPCHARNIAGIAHAFAASSAVLAGFSAVLPFDEMAAAAVRVGADLHPDLRCTARGGCAGTPTAVELTKRP